MTDQSRAYTRGQVEAALEEYAFDQWNAGVIRARRAAYGDDSGGAHIGRETGNAVADCICGKCQRIREKRRKRRNK